MTSGWSGTRGVMLAAASTMAAAGHARLRRRHRALVALDALTTALVGALATDDVVRTLLSWAGTVVDAERAELVVLGARGSAAPLVHRLRAGADSVELGTLDAGLDAVREQVLRTGVSVRARSDTADPELAALLDAAGARDAVAVAVRGFGDVRAVLLVAGRRTGHAGFSTADVRLLESVAERAAVALDHARLIGRLRWAIDRYEHQSVHDQLTGLANRVLFHRMLDQAIMAAEQHAGSQVAVLLIDVDRFKDVNESFGSHIGDRLLQEIAERLGQAASDGEVVARLGDDEFALLVPEVVDAAAAVAVARRVRQAFEPAFTVSGLTLHMDVSLGIALYPEHGEVALTLVQRAVLALEAAKTAHSNVEVATTDPDDRPRLGGLELHTELRAALANDQLQVHYQPQVELASRRLVRVEALLRWVHPRHGPIAPADFIATAERTGLIHALTEFVVDAALRQCREWRRAGLDVDVAVNLAVGNLREGELADQVARALERTGTEPAALTLEITESELMMDPERAVAGLGALRAIGVRLSIDDFGTGYPSLAHLKRLPVDELKIDRSFVSGMAEDDHDAAIVRSTIQLARNLGLRVVAEGVGDARTWAQLLALGCDLTQGFYVSRALPAAAMEGWLAEWSATDETPHSASMLRGY